MEVVPAGGGMKPVTIPVNAFKPVFTPVVPIANTKATPPNPFGSQGKPDHQQKVNELEKKAQSEAKPGETVLKERKIQGQNSNRRPDAQIVNRKGVTRKVFEAERKPTSTRNIKREQEYKKLKVAQETHKVGP